MWFHLILVLLATLAGYDLIRRLSPVKIPGVVARVVIAVVAIVLWMTSPVSILVGLAVAGAAAIVGPYFAVEPYHQPWGETLRDMVQNSKQNRKQEKAKRIVEGKMDAMGKRFEVNEKIGQRISRL